mmetsp:Transcript_26687/g.43638  ORF Transcript_26687/g.43638 Transcript_26687/m.43638 type:complete len:87 (+) Transcript_26687:67-327(+)
MLLCHGDLFPPQQQGFPKLVIMFPPRSKTDNTIFEQDNAYTGMTNLYRKNRIGMREHQTSSNQTSKKFTHTTRERLTTTVSLRDAV